MLDTVSKLLTFEDYLTYEDGTDQHYELVDGALIVMNPPTVAHFLIAKFIEQVLDTEIKRLSLPWLSFREAGVRTGYRKSRLTDLCIVTKDMAQALQGESAVFQTAPLLIVEVVSPDSIKRDYRYKRSEYAALAVPEYWIVDPLISQVSVLLWEEGLYEETVFVEQQPLRSSLFPELQLTVAEVLNSGVITE